MNAISGALLLVVALVAFNQVRDGTLGPWIRSKFFNAGDPNRPPTDTPTNDAGGGEPGAVPVGVQSGGWIRPSSGRVSSGFGPRWGRNHNGIDLAAPTGTPVRAARGGRVRWSGSRGTAGVAVIIDHGGGWETHYYHLSRTETRVGAQVAAGEQIGRIGSTGRSTGAHLHFEIRKGGTPIDPAPYIGAGAEAVSA